jgi:hypothetical protein
MVDRYHLMIGVTLMFTPVCFRPACGRNSLTTYRTDIVVIDRIIPKLPVTQNVAHVTIVRYVELIRAHSKKPSLSDVRDGVKVG